MVFGNVHPRIGSTMFVLGQRSAMFLWQCSSKVVAMFLRLDAFQRLCLLYLGNDRSLWRNLFERPRLQIHTIRKSICPCLRSYWLVEKCRQNPVALQSAIWGLRGHKARESLPQWLEYAARAVNSSYQIEHTTPASAGEAR